MNMLTEQERKEGYRLLFDGTTLNGWSATRHPEEWLVKEGNLVCTGEGSGYLYTTERFENFTLHVEYRTAPKTNSGVFFRWSDLADPVNSGLEMQILDTYDQQEMDKHSSGALYDLIAPSSNAVRPAGDWNQIRIACNRGHVQLTLNGTIVVETDIDQWTVAGHNPDGTTNKFKYAWRDQPRSGHIGLQNHGGYIEFRNIKLVGLDA